MYAKAERVGRRRLKRRLKAAVSIGVAVAAGTFLACQKQVSKFTDKPSEGPKSSDQPVEVPGPAATTDRNELDSAPDAAAAGEPDAAPTVSGRPALPPSPSARDAAPRVDRKEHRKGMPVRDNLLE